MRIRIQPLLVGALLLGMLATLAGPTAQAQAQRRWVAGPDLITTVKAIGPNGGEQVIDTITDLDLASPTTGWATSYGSLLRLDGQQWRVERPTAPTESLLAIDMVSATEGWAVGRYTVPQPPYQPQVELLSLSGGSWQSVAGQILRADGTRGSMQGQLVDVAASPGRAIAIGAQPSDLPDQSRPLVLGWDGRDWRDITPAEWRYGSLAQISMVSPTEGWATGRLGRLGDHIGSGDDEFRAVILHYRDGQWLEERTPVALRGVYQASLGDIVMRDATEGWAVYSIWQGACQSSTIWHFQGGTWAPVDHAYAATIDLGLIPGTNRGWASVGGCSSRGVERPAQRMRFDTGVMTPDPAGARLVPSAYALLSEDVQWAAARGALLRYTADSLPTDRVAQPAGSVRYFPETGHTLAGEFRSYYETHGLEMGDRGVSVRESLGLFGYPVSEPFDEINPDTGRVLRVQYFERARMELHPENQPPYRVLLGRLAASALLTTRLIQRGDGAVGPGCRGFPETGQQLCAPLRGFWERSGGLPVFGLPLKPVGEETSVTDGRLYLTQWFERERLEHHPELRGTPYEVLLGLLGSEQLRERGMLP